MPSSDSFEEFLGEEVVDKEGLPAGVFACYWEHEEGKPVLLGIHCNGDDRRTHVVPAKGARLNASQTYVAVPFPRTTIEQAPALDCDCELNGAFEKSVCAYYGLPATALPTPTDSQPPPQWKRIATPANKSQTPSGDGKV